MERVTWYSFVIITCSLLHEILTGAPPVRLQLFGVLIWPSAQKFTSYIEDKLTNHGNIIEKRSCMMSSKKKQQQFIRSLYQHEFIGQHHHVIRYKQEHCFPSYAQPRLTCFLYTTTNVLVMKKIKHTLRRVLHQGFHSLHSTDTEKEVAYLQKLLQFYQD